MITLLRQLSPTIGQSKGRRAYPKIRFLLESGDGKQLILSHDGHDFVLSRVTGTKTTRVLTRSRDLTDIISALATYNVVGAETLLDMIEKIEDNVQKLGKEIANYFRDIAGTQRG